MRRPAASAAALAAVVLALGPSNGCARESAKSKTAATNVLLLVIDALRPDHLGTYGYRRDTSPTIDRLAAEGFLFEQARSAANFTRASVPSMLTGFYPGAHGVFDKQDQLSDRFRMLAEILHDRGWATAAFVPNPSLVSGLNFGQGFDLWDDEVLPKKDDAMPAWARFETAVRIQTRALAFLDHHPGRPYFLYLHYRDVHGPYVPPPPYDRRYWNPERAARNSAARRLTPVERQRLGDYLRSGEDQGLLDYYVDQYDGEIRYTDDRLAEFLTELRKRGALENTLIIVTADHGEAFLEHEEWEHGGELHEEQMRVPLIFRLPGAPRHAVRLTTPVSGVDLMPTVLDLVGEAERPENLQGLSLRPLLEEGALAPRPLFAEGNRRRVAIWWQGYKLQRWKTGDSWALWNLVSDPGERSNLGKTEPDRARLLRKRIEDFQRGNRRLSLVFPRGRLSLDEATEEQLRSLGYI